MFHVHYPMGSCHWCQDELTGLRVAQILHSDSGTLIANHKSAWQTSFFLLLPIFFSLYPSCPTLRLTRNTT